MKNHPASYQVSVIALAAVLSSLFGAGCGKEQSSTQPTATNAPPKVVRLRVGVIPVAECALLLDTNAFGSRGIQIEVQKANSGTQISDGVVGGGLDFGFSNLLTPLLANNENIPLRAIGVVSVESDARPRHALLVLKKSRFTSPADLAGARIAVNSLNNIDHVLLKRWLKAHKVDPATVKFTVVGFPDMLTQLKNSAVDGVALVEPFVTIAKGSPDEYLALGNYFVAPNDNTTLVSGFVAREDWIKRNKDVARKVNEALQEAAARSVTDPDTFRKWVKAISPIDENIVQKMPVPWYTNMIPDELLNGLITASQEQNLLSTNINARVLRPDW